MVRGQGPVTVNMRGRLAALARGALVAGLLVAAPAAAAARDFVFAVPRTTIYPGEVITDSMLFDKTFRGKEFEGPGFAATREALIGKVARTTLLPKVPVSSAGVREPFAVQQGQPAVVIFRSGALVISATAVSLQAGATGDVISLRNTDSGTTIRGTVQADGTVRVGTP
jgi:flagella basal body P-ring formation protein FlgA